MEVAVVAAVVEVAGEAVVVVAVVAMIVVGAAVVAVVVVGEEISLHVFLAKRYARGCITYGRIAKYTQSKTYSST